MIAISGQRRGLPGQVSMTGYDVPAGLTYTDAVEIFAMLGDLGRACPWWVVDALLYAELHFGEAQFSQLAESLGWEPKTLLNHIWVGKAVPRSLRRERLTFGHHAAVAALTYESQVAWLDRAERGATLPNGEWQRWSVAHLRREIKAYVGVSDRRAHGAGGELRTSEGIRSLSPSPAQTDCATGAAMSSELPAAPVQRVGLGEVVTWNDRPYLVSAIEVILGGPEQGCLRILADPV